MPTAPAPWTMGTTWQQRQAAGPDWRTELRPVRSAIADRERAPTPSFGPPIVAPPGGGGGPGPQPWQPTEGPTSLEDLASNWGNSPGFSPPGLGGEGPPGLNGFGPPGQGGGTPGGFGMGGGPPAWGNRLMEMGLGPGNSGQQRSQHASMLGGGPSGGFGNFRPSPARPPMRGTRPRRRRF